MDRLRIATVALVLIIGATAAVAGQEDEPGPSALASAIPGTTAPAESWLDEQTCTDPTFLTPASGRGDSTGDLGSCARRLGLRKRDPAYDAYDFRISGRTQMEDRYTEQCDDAGNHVGSRYRMWGTDRLYDVEKPDRTVSGTFDISIVSTLLDPDAGTWQVEKRGSWELHSADGDFTSTWSAHMTMPSERPPGDPSRRPDDPSEPWIEDMFRQYRPDDPGAWQAVCDYLK